MTRDMHSLWAGKKKKKPRKQKSFGVDSRAVYLRVTKNIFRWKGLFFLVLVSHEYRIQMDDEDDILQRDYISSRSNVIIYLCFFTTENDQIEIIVCITISVTTKFANKNRIF